MSHIGVGGAVKKTACPMIARSDWGVGNIQQKGLAHSLSLVQSTVGFQGPRTAGWLIFLNGAHRGEDMRLAIGECKIGSEWSCDCVLTGVGIRSKHATIRMGVDEAMLIPASVSRDVKVNNVSVSDHTSLEDGDLISLGDLHAVFRFAQAMTPGYRPKSYAKPDSMPVQSSPQFLTCGWLIMLKGPLMGQDFRLISGLNRIGSKPDLEVSIPDSNLVDVGFVLECTAAKGCIVKDIKNDRGLKINGSLCDVGKFIQDSDVVAFDHLEMLVKWL